MKACVLNGLVGENKPVYARVGADFLYCIELMCADTRSYILPGSVHTGEDWCRFVLHCDSDPKAEKTITSQDIIVAIQANSRLGEFELVIRCGDIERVVHSLHVYENKIILE